MSVPAYSPAVEDYLRAIYKAEEDGQRVTTMGVATALGVSGASATAMLKRLAALGLIDHLAYRGAELTAAGRREALRVTRNHRLLEQYLAITLDMPLDSVDAEADRLEHRLSDRLERRIDHALGGPTHDPHGHPIPSRELRPGAAAEQTLAQLEPGESGTIRQIPDHDPGLLTYLAHAGLLPGAHVEVGATGPFGDPLTVRTAEGETAVARAVAALIRVD